MQFNRKYIIGSLIAHLLIIVIATVISMCNRNIKKTFVVFGAHSRKPTFVSYKSSKIVPFVGNGSSRKGKGSGGKGTGKGKSNHANKRAHITASSKKSKTNLKRVAKKSYKPTTGKHKQSKKHVSSHPKTHKAQFHELGAKVKIKNKKDLHKIGKQTTAQHKQKQKKPPAKQKMQEKKIVTPPEPDDEEVKEEQTPPPPMALTPSEKEETKEQPVVDEKTIVDNTDAALPDDQNPQQEDPDEDLDDDSGFNLVGEYDHKDLVMYQKHVQREVDRLWRPPLGVPKGTVCTILFSVDDDGTVETFDFIKRSSVLIYDLSVIRIAKNFQFDKCLWGKQFKIDFRQ